MLLVSESTCSGGHVNDHPKGPRAAVTMLGEAGVFIRVLTRACGEGSCLPRLTAAEIPGPVVIAPNIRACLRFGK